MLLYKSTSLTAGNVITEVNSLVKDTASEIWSEAEKLYTLKQAVRNLHPDIFVPKTDTSLSTSSTSYSYTVPSSMDLILAVKIQPDSSSSFEDVGYYVEPGATNSIILHNLYSSGLTIKVVGGARLTIPESTDDDLDIPLEAEDLLILGMQMQLFQTLLMDKSKLNQFAARETEVTEMDVLNMLKTMKDEYRRRKSEVNSVLLMQITRV